jgi:hypothetical protein
MSHQIRDLYCVDCGEPVFGVACAYREYPDCASCGGEMRVTWEGGQPPSTDVYGCAQYSDATGECHTSQRAKARVMAEAGYHEAGDPVGGARIEHRLNGTGFSFSGQGSRRTVSEGRA